MDLKRKIAMLEAENKKLKEESGGAGGRIGTGKVDNDRDWMGSMGTANRANLQSRGGGIGQIERPVTASA